VKFVDVDAMAQLRWQWGGEPWPNSDGSGVVKVPSTSRLAAGNSLHSGKIKTLFSPMKNSYRFNNINEMGLWLEV